MDKMIVVVFDIESDAYKAAHAIEQLHNDESIELYSGAIIVKDESGKVRLRESKEEAPFAMALGAAIGAMIGALGGVPGALAGSALGAAAGLPADVYQLGVGSDFVEEVGNYLESGKSAVVAELNETSTTPLDKRMEELGGQVFRKASTIVRDEEFDG